MTVPQHDTTTLVVLGLVALHPGSGFEQPDDGRAYCRLRSDCDCPHRRP